MAPIMADSSSVKSNRASITSRKVRVIGKIKGFTEKESESVGRDSKPWITVKRPQEQGTSEKCTVFLDTQSTSRRNEYELDYCYEQNEESEEIYSKEIKPLILEVFNGQNASIIALGARGSGKTYTIQGSQEKPGLAVMAMSEILSKAKELRKSVSVSLYELTQEHVKDLLNPNHPIVQVLEDAQGKINLKGLSQVPVNSTTEFQNIYLSQGSSQSAQKIPVDQPCNKGLMVHISSQDDKPKAKSGNKINFVDLAGYEDPKKGSRDGITPVESTRKNKALYALLNVVSAINAGDTRVPYRESKLTRILQDSLGGTSHVLLLTLLNPFICQDSLSSISLVSRSCRSTKQVLTDSTNRNQSSAKVKVLSSLENGKKVSASLSVKKHVSQSRLFSAKKANTILKGRKLFDEVKIVNPTQLKCQSEDTSTNKSKILPNLASILPPFSLEEGIKDKSVSECRLDEETTEEGNIEEPMSNAETSLVPSVANDKAVVMLEMDVSACEENKCLYKKDDGSPLLSERIKEISNNLKALCASTPSTIKMPQDIVAPCSSQYADIIEPQTPNMELNAASYCSPCGNFSNRSTGVKHSLVREYLNFLNSANKEQLKSLKGIGEKRATYILELREESPEPFKSLDDLQDIGLSGKQIKGMMRQVAGDLFN